MKHYFVKLEDHNNHDDDKQSETESFCLDVNSFDGMSTISSSTTGSDIEQPSVDATEKQQSHVIQDDDCYPKTGVTPYSSLLDPQGFYPIQAESYSLYRSGPPANQTSARSDPVEHYNDEYDSSEEYDNEEVSSSPSKRFTSEKLDSPSVPGPISPVLQDTKNRRIRGMILISCFLIVILCVMVTLIGLSLFTNLSTLSNDSAPPAPTNSSLPSGSPPTDPPTLNRSSTTRPSPAIRPTLAPATRAPLPSVISTITRPTSSTPSSPAPSTTAPTATTWRIVGGPFSDVVKGTSYGNSVALANGSLFVGNPGKYRIGGVSDLGNVTIFQQSTNWSQIKLNNTTVPTFQFGFSVDATSLPSGRTNVVIGAINTKIGGYRYGSAHCLEFGPKGWVQVGTMMQPILEMTETADDFGSAVAMAAMIRRVVVGAPSSSVNSSWLHSGKVYTFDWNGTDWYRAINPLSGRRPSMRLGSAVDLSPDGSKLVVGSPGDGGGDGSFSYYGWTGFNWNEMFSSKAVDGSLEALGTQVSIVTEDGKTIAIGGPNYNNSRGIIRIYEQDASSFSFLKTAELVGQPGEQLGSTIRSAKGRLACGTNNGTFRLYEKVGTSWGEVLTRSSSALGSPVVSIAISEDSKTVAVGLEREEVCVFQAS